MNEPLSTAAKHALSDSQVESLPGFCQRFVREVVQKLYGHKFDKWLAKPTARLAAAAWMRSPYAVDPSHGSVPGDILFFTKGHDENGHVVIRIEGNLVAENSRVHRGPHGAKGVRRMDEIGTPDLIVRLPPP